MDKPPIQAQKEKPISRGTQIVYVPTHVRQNTKKDDWLIDPDSEFGFIWTDEGDTALCRYFSRSNMYNLRTRSNSERTDKEDIFIFNWTSQRLIDKWVHRLESENQDNNNPPEFKF